MEIRQVLDNCTTETWATDTMLCSLAHLQGRRVVTITEPSKDIVAVWRIPTDACSDFFWSLSGHDRYSDSMHDMLAEDYLDAKEIAAMRAFARHASEAFGQLGPMPDLVTDDLDSAKTDTGDLDQTIYGVCNAVLDWGEPGSDLYTRLRNAGYSDKVAAQLKLEHSRLVATAMRLKQLYKEGKE